jgi:hypothetical protein
MMVRRFSHDWKAAIFTADDPGCRAAQPGRVAAHAPTFRREGISDRLVSDECRKNSRPRVQAWPLESTKVVLELHGQAEQILQDEQADLIAVGREILNNPNWPMDEAVKPGVEGFRDVPPQFGWWQATRARRGFGPAPSTWQNGLNDNRKLL